MVARWCWPASAKPLGVDPERKIPPNGTAKLDLFWRRPSLAGPFASSGLRDAENRESALKDGAI